MSCYYGEMDLDSAYFDSPWCKTLTTEFAFLVLSYLPKCVQEQENFNENFILEIDNYQCRLKFSDTLEELGYNAPHLFKWVKMKEHDNS